MFNRGIDALLEGLPDLPGLSTAQVRRLLTQAWLEATDLQSTTPLANARTQRSIQLRRLASALEIHAIITMEIERSVLRACAFVAAEALQIADEKYPLEIQDQQFYLFGSVRQFERVEAGLLYLIAGYDANAALSVRRFRRLSELPHDPESPVAQWALSQILTLLSATNTSITEFTLEPPTDASLRSLVRYELWRRIGTHVADHVQWLRFDLRSDPDAGAALRSLAERLEVGVDARPAAVAHHADLHHLALVLAAACDATGERALRRVPAPPGDSGRFTTYQQRRARTRPLLWPAAHDYAREALPGPRCHAVVSVPTGAGKSSVAELAIAQALRGGWVLYLAPTNALVGQIRRQCADIFGAATVRDFIGGAEYTELAYESLDEIGEHQVLVMTPEKCSLALRQNPEAFARLSMCVLDEAHILGERKGRGAIAELVLAEILHRAPHVRLLFLSALMANAQEITDWLEDATQTPAVVIDEPWRPTRTLRAIAGFDRDRASQAGEAAWERLSQLGARRKTETFMAPISLLAGLQGAWSSPEADDYDLVKTDIEVQLKVLREPAQISSDGYVNLACAALVQTLGEQGDRVLTFLPSNKHFSFLVASRMAGFSAQPFDLGRTVDAFLTLAEAELGVASQLRTTLGKRIAVHTGALLREEQRASEVAFDQEIALAMFATGTMAQGLNLPATAVVVGGTDIGYDNEATAEEKAEQARSQLLNAIGRAGRAHVAPRSMAIVVPNKAVYLSSADEALSVVGQAEFLREEDASTTISSSLQSLIVTALGGELDMDAMSTAEQTATTYLSFADGQVDTPGVLSKSWAIHQAQATAYVSVIADRVGRVGQAYVADAGAPPWLSLAANRSGIALPETLHLYNHLRGELSGYPPPTDIPAWADLMIDLLRTFEPHELKRILPSRPYGESRLSGIYSPNPATRYAAWSAYKHALAAWMTGKPLIRIAESIHKKPVNQNARRGAQDPLPRTITVVSDAFRFRLSMTAGALGALVTTGREYDPFGPWNLPEASHRSLTLLPLAVRSGAASPETLAWIRAGAQPRVVAHLLSDSFDTPVGLDDDELRRWASWQLSVLLDNSLEHDSPVDNGQLLRALAATRDAR